jgi:cell division protein FtsW
MKFFTRTDKSIFGRWWWTVDRVTLTVFAIIAVMGIMLVAAASPPVATRIGIDPNHFTIRHLIVLVPALSAMIAISMMNLQQVWRTALVVFGFSILSMIAVLFVGEEIKGRAALDSIAGFFTAAI